MSDIPEMYEYGKQTIFFSDSSIMKELGTNTIKTCVTSPPYNRGKTYQSNNGELCNDDLPIEEYSLMLSNVFNEVFRVLTEDGLLFLNVGDSAYDKYKSNFVLQLAINQGFNHVDTIIWVKSMLGRGHYTPSGGNRRLNNIWENIFILSKTKNYDFNPKAIGIPYADKTNIGRYSDVDLRDAGNVWFIPYERTTSKHIQRFQDSVFPVLLPIKCMLLNNSTSVLDPFAGSCTTNLGAEFLGIRGYGYEKFPNKIGIEDNLKRQLPKSLLLPDILISDMEMCINYLSSIAMGKQIRRNTKKFERNLSVINSVLERIGTNYRI
jgi:site-specific DNA-methyltransferase (adenine-specific)